VIDRVHQLARRDKVGNGGLLFETRAGDDDDDAADDDNDTAYDPEESDDDHSTNSDDLSYVDDVQEVVDNPRRGARRRNAGVRPTQNDDESDDDESDGADDASDSSDESFEPDEDDDDPNDDDLHGFEDEDVAAPGVTEAEDADDGAASDSDESEDADQGVDNGVSDDDEGGDNSDSEADEDAPDEEEALNEEMDTKYGERRSAHHLRPRKLPFYKRQGHSHATWSLKSAALEAVIESFHASAFSQHSMNAGIKKFGDRGTEAVRKELQQLHDRQVMVPKHRHELTELERSRSLGYLMFLKEKSDGSIKGRGCADGRPQRAYIPKEDAASPTVRNESTMLTATIDARERRDVATVDLPGAFMQADMDDVVHMRLTGAMVQILGEIDATYSKFVCIEKGKQVIYVQLAKALYGTLKAAMLFWRKLTKFLEDLGFVTNPYDRCVANKMVNGKQCTVAWHVDDLKISHVDPAVVSDVIKALEGEFANEAPLTITRGKVHEYLGMTLDYSIDGKVMIQMYRYIRDALAELPTDMDGKRTTPAADHLFDVNEQAIKLGEEKADLFHHCVAKLLFLCKRARPDIQTAIAFLCTRVQAPDVDDYKKLVRVMQYLRETETLTLTLEGDDTSVTKWWADASFAVHKDSRSHTGGAMTLGKGVIYGTSTRQKLNTRSSTEAELVAADDVMGQLLWTQHFLQGQGYPTKAVLYQDNQAAILLEKNGQASSGKRTRHLNVRYFFITDRIGKGELTVEYCPTKQMLADFFTKPLQGSLFQALRDQVMNVDPASTTTLARRSVLEVNTGTAGLGVTLTVTDDDGSTGWTVVDRKSTSTRRCGNRGVEKRASKIVSSNSGKSNGGCARRFPAIRP
jgi:hypothetical protein